MILLQAAIAAGAVLTIILGVVLLIGVPVLTSILMQLFRKNNGTPKGTPYYKEPALLIPSLLIAASVTIALFWLLILLLDELLPSYGYSN
jgi:uncharacterized membrane protein